MSVYPETLTKQIWTSPRSPPAQSVPLRVKLSWFSVENKTEIGNKIEKYENTLSVIRLQQNSTRTLHRPSVRRRAEPGWSFSQAAAEG